MSSILSIPRGLLSIYSGRPRTLRLECSIPRPTSTRGAALLSRVSLMSIPSGISANRL